MVRTLQLDSVAQLVRALYRNHRAAGSTPTRGPIVAEWCDTMLQSGVIQDYTAYNELFSHSDNTRLTTICCTIVLRHTQTKIELFPFIQRV